MYLSTLPSIYVYLSKWTFTYVSPVEASKQCLRLHVPEISPVTAFSDYIEQLCEGSAERTVLWGSMPSQNEVSRSLFSYLASCTQPKYLKTLPSTVWCGYNDILFHTHTHRKEVVCLVGPEGDFSDKEKHLIQGLPDAAVAVSLSPHRLRVETAALVFASLTSSAWLQRWYHLLSLLTCEPKCKYK